MMQNSLDLGLVGNGCIGALIDAQAEIVWCCMPRFDADPVFCSLLKEHTDQDSFGYCTVELVEQISVEQQYLPNTAVLVTRMTDADGGVIEITDFAPRFHQFGRMFTPVMLIRQIKRLQGSPRIRLVVRPAGDYGRERCPVTYGSHHIRYLSPGWTMRLTTDASITMLMQELPFFLDDSVTLIFGADETIPNSIGDLSRRFLDETVSYWHEWVRDLGIPFEWQDAVIRAAITLKLNTYDDTGAIIAAMTTSIPEAANTVRNWDYRFCWLRDSYFVVNALNRLGATKTMERYLGYLANISAAAPGGRLQPVYAIDGKAHLEEQIVESLPGYRGMGPVRRGNQAFEQIQHDVYGSAILAVTHIFFDKRLLRCGDAALFQRLESLGETARQVFDQPDAGLWELRGTARVHTFSSVMCWAACDRLALIAQRLGLQDRIRYWRDHADHIYTTIYRRAWNEDKQSFVASFEGDAMDASLLLLHDVGFLSADDPCFVSTVSAIEKELKRGDYIYRYVEADDFGEPENAFLVCTFWYIHALAALGRMEEARSLFENLLTKRNRLGLLAEHIDPRTGELWGNFVQTYSMVGLINSAIRLSKRWDTAF
ncbi:MAG: glycoside hydrolase family 15 protein [Trichlorobacter sp.]|uniref:glycoside hydrolase family 15 protein n=1 Tax=Trichlorobacter sp. TaxID=2911007 RepID=UPI002567FC49|nr:glycoside hydrolase family 15 protein [Trichlorobacter sp.]MDK9718299.1 glycoside hydrolase family 15 protein [Trichlorobacter sp.]